MKKMGWMFFLKAARSNLGVYDVLKVPLLHQPVTFLSPGAIDEILTYRSHLANCRPLFMSGTQKGLGFEKVFKLLTYSGILAQEVIAKI